MAGPLPSASCLVPPSPGPWVMRHSPQAPWALHAEPSQPLLWDPGPLVTAERKGSQRGSLGRCTSSKGQLFQARPLPLGTPSGQLEAGQAGRPLHRNCRSMLVSASLPRSPVEETEAER